AVAVDGGELERRDVEARLRVDVGARQEQCVDDGQIVGLGRDVQRGRAVALRRLYVGAAVEQRAYGCAVVMFDGFNQGARLGSAGGARGSETEGRGRCEQ